jgi:transcriptional regulator GlxA family with amidase domain
MLGTMERTRIAARRHRSAALPTGSGRGRRPGPVRRVAVLVYPGLQALDAVGPLEVFAAAGEEARARRGGAPFYALAVVAREAGPVATSSGYALVAERGIAQVRGAIDTLLVVGGAGTRAAVGDRALIDWIQRQAPRARRIASVCTGAFLLAEAGLLDGLRVTTHWASAGLLQHLHPRITVDPDPIWIRAGRIWTSAGVTSGMDLALALVEEDLGREVALAVARRLVLFLKRPGGQSQFSAQLAGQLAERAPLRDLQAWVAEHPEADLSVEALAARAAMSPRHFARVFAHEVGRTPARFVEEARVEAARRRLEESDAGIEAIAAGCGFGTAETMRRAFLRVLRVGPAAYRARFRSGSAA